MGLARAATMGVRWPLWRIAAFFGLGLGLYAVINFGFLGTNSLTCAGHFQSGSPCCFLLYPPEWR
ncbi:hypothetical protein NHF46_15675 [Arthrobacter alpinus]|nr:hypothetical protein [Arthrobacter alpinus]